MSTAPASAVPNEAPRFIEVFWSPPTSALRDSSTAETVTAPSWDAMVPMPRPRSSIGIATTPALAVGLIPKISTRVPASIKVRPMRTSSFGEPVGKRRGTSMADRRRASESGTSLTPVARALNSRTTDKKRGMVKKTPACARYWKKNMVMPPTTCRFVSSSGSIRGARFAALSRSSLNARRPSTTAPTSSIQITGEWARMLGSFGLAVIHPHSPDLRTPSTMSARPMIDNKAPIRSNF